MLKEIITKRAHFFVDELGMRQGENKEWFRSGQLWEQSFYVDNLYYGEYKQWHKNGQLMQHCFYANGEKHSKQKKWHDNGQMYSYCFYLNDLKHGEYIEWFRDGQIFLHCFYINNKQVSFDEIPYPLTTEDHMYFMLKYNIPLLPAEILC